LDDRQDKSDSVAPAEQDEERLSIEEQLSSGAWEERLAKARELRKIAIKNKLSNQGDAARHPLEPPMTDQEVSTDTVPLNVRIEEASKQHELNTAHRRKQGQPYTYPTAQSVVFHHKETVQRAMSTSAFDSNAKRSPESVAVPSPADQPTRQGRSGVLRIVYISLGLVIGLGAGLLFNIPKTEFISLTQKGMGESTEAGQSAILSSVDQTTIAVEKTTLGALEEPGEQDPDIAMAQASSNDSAVIVSTNSVRLSKQLEFLEQSSFPESPNSSSPNADREVTRIAKTVSLFFPNSEQEPTHTNIPPALRGKSGSGSHDGLQEPAVFSNASMSAMTLTPVIREPLRGYLSVSNPINIPAQTVAPFSAAQRELHAQRTDRDARQFAGLAGELSLNTRSGPTVNSFSGAKISTASVTLDAIDWDRPLPTQNLRGNGILLNNLGEALRSRPKVQASNLTSLSRDMLFLSSISAAPVILATTSPRLIVSTRSFDPLVSETRLPKPYQAARASVKVLLLPDVGIVDRFDISTKPPKMIAHLAIRNAPRPRPDLNSGQGAIVPDNHLEFTISINAPASLPEDKLSAFKDALSETGYPVGKPNRVGFNIRKNNVRFFHPEDRETAQLLATAIDGKLRDFTSYSPAPLVGTIEIWLAGGAPSRPGNTIKRRTTTEDPALTALRSRLLQSLRRGDHL